MSSPSTWRGVVKFDVTDVELYRLVEKRANHNLSWDEIADEIGCEVKPLVEWFLAFKQPARLPMVRTGVVTYAGKPVAPNAMAAERYAAWRKATAGAAKTRAENA